MPHSASAALLALILPTALPAVTEPPSLPSCEAGVRYIELMADATGKPPEVCIRPGFSTTFLFDSKRVRVELAGRERFERIMEGRDFFGFVPSESLRDGERILVSFHFEDGAAPEHATFILVVHPSQAEQQVEVSRNPRPVAAYRQEALQARAEVRQCQEEKAHLQARCGGRGGLTGLLAQELVGDGGVLSRNIKEKAGRAPGGSLLATQARSYRTTTRRTNGDRKVIRVAVEVWLLNGGTEPWRVEGAALLGPDGVALQGVEVWQSEPLHMGASLSVVVEVKLLEGEAEGPFLLKLWPGAGDTRSVSLHGVTFP
jgi:uncharacterized protein (TIGR02268 family)